MLFKTIFEKTLNLHFFFRFYFIFIIMLVYTHWWIIPNQSTFFNENKVQWKKLFLQNIYFFLSSVVCTPTDKTVGQKNLWRMFFNTTNFSEKKVFFQHSCATPLVIFTEQFKKLFSWIYFSMTKNIYSEECFSSYNFDTLHSH